MAIRSWSYRLVHFKMAEPMKWLDRQRLALAITMFAFNFLGDGLRDALDPRLRGTQ